MFDANVENVRITDRCSRLVVDIFCSDLTLCPPGHLFTCGPGFVLCHFHLIPGGQSRQVNSVNKTPSLAVVGVTIPGT